MVPRRRLELPRLSALASKTSVSTIPPPGHIEALCLVLSVLPHGMVGIECFYMVPVVGFELTTYALQVRCSTTELRRRSDLNGT